MTKYILSLTVSLVSFCFLFPQGKLMVAGGGIEYTGGWSDAPYSWAIQQAKNHRVAIISPKYNPENREEYFRELGAAKVRYFVFSFPALANHKPTLDSLMKYDFWFFDEAEPHELYGLFRGTKLDSAIDEKFRQGGVLGANGKSAAIFSGVIFTESYGEIESIEALGDLRDARIHLKNDFLGLMDGYIIDPFFSEKGRLGRNLAFMARWWLEKKEKIASLGLDQQTALCVDSTGNGFVLGTGAVSILINDISAENFKIKGGKPEIDSLRVVQLLEGDRFNLISWEINSGAVYQIPDVREESADRILLFSGGSDLSASERFLDTLIYGTGNPSDQILIITGASDSYAQVVKAILESRGVSSVSILQTLAVFSDNQVSNGAILAADKFLFTHNDPLLLKEFFHTGINGPLLQSRLYEPGAISAFIAEDCSLAGPWLVSLQQVRSAMLSGGENGLFLHPGLGLLHTTAVIPQSENNDNYFAHPTTGLPYLMINKNLAFGVSLAGGTFLKYYTGQNQTWIRSYGANPVLLLQNPGTHIHLADSQYLFARNSTGFDNMRLSVLDSTSFRLGKLQTPPAPAAQETGDWISIYPNPVKESLNILLTGAPSGTYTFQLLNSEGQSAVSRTFVLQPATQTVNIPVPDLMPGVYMLVVREAGQKVVKRIQVIR
ncbi:MAG: T9SS type A sorting domain-containing protein [Bacteroidia bacterium]|nr:T9SS type A sorting domain-containing protein [Bacteroidia bacterium]